MTAERFRELVEVGQKVAVITSQYGCENSDYRTMCYMHHSTVRSLLKSGDFVGRTFWRGAELTRVK